MSPNPPQKEARESSKLARATKPFAKEDRAKTWRLLFTSGLVFFAGLGTALFAPFWPLQLLGAVIAGLTNVRLFIFYHDYLHGALFRNSKLGQALMTMVGLYTLSPPSVWRQTHDYHHLNNAKMLGTAIGSYPVVTTRIWKLMKPKQKKAYAFARHPLTMVFGYFTVFLGGMCTAAFLRDPKTHWAGPAAALLHFLALIIVGFTLGPVAAFFGVFLPPAISMFLGAYLFYAQHNYPDAQFKDRREWDYYFAALHCSSYFEMNPVMHWFTGNIGYHHVHHLNHKIPFYRLPEAMDAIPELQNPGRTSWAPADVMACLRLKLWDPDQKRMVSWEEAASEQPALAAK